ncbi:SusC/RagA family TonB-linked outer membrane protein [Chitinophaga deserti]|uniref:SusC/RagA family TonB-linked outer membrane protein n=1 Tax=Chitinophaga deserti TaxID=2164099 RepID=UPI001300667D|nr:TonB-dependent receptor [Chitinophaga deserti]
MKRTSHCLKIIISLCLGLCVWLLPFIAAAQSAGEWRLSGIVKGIDGTPLPGVSVALKGTSRGTATDENGRYALSVPAQPGALVFKFIGMLPQEIPFTAAGTQNVTLRNSEESLNEVVVVGYGTMKKSSLTASVSKLENVKLDQIPVGRVESALTGRIAGVNIAQTSSAPGAAPVIRIRGAGSIDASNDPLVVIDGFPGAGLGSISMNDIASIEVLKDASSAAIYGSRAAGGVIIVTTRKGRTGKPVLSVNSFAGVSSPMLHNDWLTGKEFYDYAVKYQNRELAWAGGDVTVPVWGDARRLAQYQVSPVLLNGVNNIWQDAVTQNAPFQNYNVSVNGGTENVRYYVSGTVKSEKGTIQTTGFNQYGIRANLDVKVNKVISAGMMINPIYSTRRLAPTSTVSLAKYPGFVPTQNEDGSYPRARDLWGAVVTSQANPMAILQGTQITQQAFNNIGELFVALQFTPSLSFKSSFAGNISYGTNERFQARFATNNGISNGTASDNRNINLLNENVLSFNKTFARHHDVNAIAGASFQKNTSRNAYMGVLPGSFENDIIKTLNNGIIDPNSTGSTKSAWGLMSYFARVNYAYKSKYLLAASIRTDGSSRFGPDNQWGYFPSASAAWRVSEEDFLKGNPLLSNLKVRASYGVTGNFNIGDFSWQGGISSTVYSPNNQLGKGKAQTSIENRALSWEKTRSYDFGVDIGLFRNRINITADYYDKRTNDLLYSVAVPAISGFTGSISNIGDIGNKGFEIEINSQNVKGKFTWNTSFNFSMNKNKVLNMGVDKEKLFEDQYGMSWLLRVGEPMFSYYGYKAIGVISSTQVLNSGIPLYPGSKLGNPIYEDVNKDGNIDARDRAILGNYQPKAIIGLVNDFAYKNFDLSIAVQANLGSKVYNYENQYYQGALVGAMRRDLVKNQWWSEAEPGDGRAPAAALSTLNFQGRSDLYIENGSFFAVRNMNLGYNFPESISRRLRMNQLRVFGSVSNLLMVTDKEYHGYNPEGYNGPYAGYNDGTEPINRVVTFGLNVQF